MKYFCQNILLIRTDYFFNSYIDIFIATDMDIMSGAETVTNKIYQKYKYNM